MTNPSEIANDAESDPIINEAPMPACPTKAQLNAIVDSLIETRSQDNAIATKTGMFRSTDSIRHVFKTAVREAYLLGHTEAKAGTEKTDFPIDPPPPTEPEPAPPRPHVHGAPA